MSALQAIKRFRTRELRGLVNHLKVFGPFPEPPISDTTTTTTTDQPTTLQLPNPFLPKFNPKSGKWHKPNYSLRRQAELVKKAHATGSMHLLPPGPKKAAFESRMQRVAAATGKPPPPPSPNVSTTSEDNKWDIPVEWVGKVPEKKVVGTELGIRLYAGKKRMFKGHLWERVRAKRIRRRSILMRDMAARVKNYKTVRASYSPIILFLKISSRLVVLQEEKTKPSQTVKIFKTSQAAILIHMISSYT